MKLQAWSAKPVFAPPLRADLGRASTGKRYDETFKLDAVRLRQQAGRPRAQVARDLGVSEVSLATWEARYGTNPDKSHPPGKTPAQSVFEGRFTRDLARYRPALPA